MLMYLNIFSSDPWVDEKFLYNFVDINVLAEHRAAFPAWASPTFSERASTRCASG